MAKYYVESGTLRLIVQAADAHSAALWAVHRAMEQVAPMYDDRGLSAHDKHARALERGFFVLGEDVLVNQRGFGQPAEQELLTFELITEWNQLMIALTKLEERLRA